MEKKRGRQNTKVKNLKKKKEKGKRCVHLRVKCQESERRQRGNRDFTLISALAEETSATRTGQMRLRLDVVADLWPVSAIEKKRVR